MSVEGIWYGRGSRVRAARALLVPLSWLFESVSSARNVLYDRGVLPSHAARIPVISVGNVSVGGTGKTPFTAHIIRELVAMGHKPAVVMRGYGDDEAQLHARMNPGVLVIANADRVSGIERAAAAGADVVVLDDGFQHRRAKRDLDIVLVSAEQWGANPHLLPAGPMREPMTALARADLVVVTQKSAVDDDVQAVVDLIRRTPALRAPIATASFQPDELVAANGVATLPLTVLKRAAVLGIAGIGDPASFFAQLSRVGALVTERRFRDHHGYTPGDVSELVANLAGHKYAVTTEKDTVKLSKLWPANGPELWYLSQAVRLTEGASLVAAALAELFKRATLIVG